jgi:perosamine synthetase
MRIPLIRPYITDEVKEKVIEVLDSGYLTEGPVTRELEKAFRDYTGCRHAIAVTSCTTGLEVALRCLRIGPGDEVIVPDYTYPATASVVAIVGATAVIVDCAPRTMNINYDAIEAAIGPRTRAIIPVSLFGNSLDFQRLRSIKQKYGVAIVEDAACTIGGEYDGRKVGTLADITVFSLHPRKFITTGEGGIITTENDEWASWMESYKHFGMGRATERASVQFDRVGTNYKLSNLQAAVGVVQMRHVDTLLERRRSLAARYTGRFADEPRTTLPETTARSKHSYQSYCIFIEDRDGVLERVRKRGIEVQIGTYALHRHAAFRNGGLFELRGAMDGSSWAFEHCLALPLYDELTDSDQDEVIDSVLRELD